MSTYRIQLHKNFNFKHLSQKLPYLDELGVCTLYFSPIFKARRGSQHGYDCVDPNQLNPELGKLKDWQNFLRHLEEFPAMGLLLDFVPNHMAASEQNPWWWDVLEKGPASPYVTFFDFFDPSQRIVLPVLGEPLPEVLRKGKITMALKKNRPILRYEDHQWPLSLPSYSILLSQVPRPLSNDLSKELRQSPGLKQELQGIFQKMSPQTLEVILERQHYQLLYWKDGRKLINYRRFFDIQELVAVRMENNQAFKSFHHLLFQLMQHPRLKGIRLDHIDGIKDPVQYLQRIDSSLREIRSGRRPLLLVEKILAPYPEREEIRSDWPVSGTTGYEFSQIVSTLFIAPKGFLQIKEFYRQSVIGDMEAKMEYEQVLIRLKEKILEEFFDSDFSRLKSILCEYLHVHDPSSLAAVEELTLALKKITVCLPVYRTYSGPHSKERERELDYQVQSQAILKARSEWSELPSSIWSWWQKLFQLIRDSDSDSGKDAKRPSLALELVMNWQQLTPALMAKGHEDTGLYNYFPLCSLNEVGSFPDLQLDNLTDQVDVILHHFHRFQVDRQRNFPQTLNNSMTHDSKRSEDMRARLHVLSEIPQLWKEEFKQWASLNRSLKTQYQNHIFPDDNMEYFIYQTLLGVWPLHPRTLRASQEKTLLQRVKDYIVKGAREAKIFSSWVDPHPVYEQALLDFVDQLFHVGKSQLFRERFHRLLDHIALPGAINSLSLLCLKVFSPGIPDFYQGCEDWSFSLVDPDNRRPVPYQTLEKKLKKIREGIKKTQEKGNRRNGCNIWRNWRKGHIKIHLTKVLLDFLRGQGESFIMGDYIPLYPQGRRKDYLICLARIWGNRVLILLAPRFLAKDLMPPPHFLPPDFWSHTFLELPSSFPLEYEEILSGKRVNLSAHTPNFIRLECHEVLVNIPLGILLHSPDSTGISSP